jgi:exonuclease III
VALQEVGDPALLSTRLSPYLLVYAAGPSHHEAGVGLLLSQELAPRIRTYKRSSTGRLIGAVLELSPGQCTLLVSAYMPSGLDHRNADSPQHELAHKLYAELLQWTVDMQQVIVMGDLNETLTPLDRHSAVAAAAPPAAAASLRPPPAALSPIRCLPQQGFTDVYRHLHPLSPGYTHCIAGVRPVQSRLDYIWCKGCSPASLLRISIDTTLHTLSHHHLLWMEVRVAHPPPAHCSTPLLRLRLPNLRAASDQHKEIFAARLQRHLHRHHHEMEELATSDDPAALSQLASHLTSLARAAAFASFPITGAAPYRSNDMLQLQHQRRALTSPLRAPRIRYCPIRRGDGQGAGRLPDPVPSVAPAIPPLHTAVPATLALRRVVRRRPVRVAAGDAAATGSHTLLYPQRAKADDACTTPSA